MANVSDVYHVKVFTILIDQIGLNVYNFQCAGKVGTGATDAQIATAFDVLFAPVYKPVMNPAANYRGVQVQKFSPLPVSTPVSSVANAGVGTGTGDPLPRQTCGLLSIKTALAGKTKRGRVYIPFPSEGDNTTGGVPVAGYVTALGNIGAAALTVVSAGAGGNTNTFNLVVWSPKLGTPQIATTIISAARWATQRRRGSFGQTNTLPI